MGASDRQRRAPIAAQHLGLLECSGQLTESQFVKPRLRARHRRKRESTMRRNKLAAGRPKGVRSCQRMKNWQSRLSRAVVANPIKVSVELQ